MLKADVEEPYIAPSAYNHPEHGITEADIVHAWTHHVDVVRLAEDKVMLIGPDTAGRLLEVGVLETDRGDLVIHAMKCRPQYRPKPPRRRNR